MYICKWVGLNHYTVNGTRKEKNTVFERIIAHHLKATNTYYWLLSIFLLPFRNICSSFAYWIFSSVDGRELP